MLVVSRVPELWTCEERSCIMHRRPMSQWIIGSCAQEKILYSMFLKKFVENFSIFPRICMFLPPIIFFFFHFSNWAYTWEIVLFSYGGKNMMSHSYFSFTEKGLDVPDLMTIIMAHPVLLKFDTALVGLDPESRTLNWTTKNNLGGIYIEVVVGICQGPH